MISQSGKSYGGKQGLPSGWPDVAGSQTPLGRHREVGLRENSCQTPWDVQHVCQLRGPSCYFPSFHAPCLVKDTRMCCLRSCRLVRCPPTLPPLTGGPELCQPAPPCPKCDMKYESRCRSEKVINTPSKHLIPCALTNRLSHTRGCKCVTKHAHLSVIPLTHILETPGPWRHAAVCDTLQALAVDS